MAGQGHPSSRTMASIKDRTSVMRAMIAGLGRYWPLSGSSHSYLPAYRNLCSCFSRPQKAWNAWSAPVPSYHPYTLSGPRCPAQTEAFPYNPGPAVHTPGIGKTANGSSNRPGRNKDSRPAEVPSCEGTPLPQVPVCTAAGQIYTGTQRACRYPARPA